MNRLILDRDGRLVSDKDRHKSRTDWTALVRTACAALRHASPQVVSRITVSGRLDDMEGEAARVATLCKCLAAEYELHEVVSVKGHTLSVRLCRVPEGDGMPIAHLRQSQLPAPG